MSSDSAGGIRPISPVGVTLWNHPAERLGIVSDTGIEHLPIPASDRPAGHGGYGRHVIAELAIAHAVAWMITAGTSGLCGHEPER